MGCKALKSSANCDYLRHVNDAGNQNSVALDLSALQPMLDVWIRKGTIAFCQEKVACQNGVLSARHKGLLTIGIVRIEIYLQ